MSLTPLQINQVVLHMISRVKGYKAMGSQQILSFHLEHP